MPNWLLPENIADVLPSEARKIEDLRRKMLDTFRDLLEDQGGSLGVTDPVSGEAVVEL